MASEPEEYLAVLKAAYDYEPQPDADEELAIRENQLLLLLERTDEEYVMVMTPQVDMSVLNFASLLVGGR